LRGRQLPMAPDEIDGSHSWADIDNNTTGSKLGIQQGRFSLKGFP
jgi:hypothetical protein